MDARTEGFDFLGYHFRGDLRLPREKSLQKFKDTVRRKPNARTGTAVLHVCPVEFSTARMVHLFSPLSLEDVPGPGRLDPRSLAQHPAQTGKRRGRARGADHRRWPNAYFDEQGCTA